MPNREDGMKRRIGFGSGFPSDIVARCFSCSSIEREKFFFRKKKDNIAGYNSR